jgi:hypothetical protein
MESRVLTAANQGVLAQALLAAGVLTMVEGTPQPANGAVASWIATAPDADAAAVWAALQAEGATLDAQLAARRVLWGAPEGPPTPDLIKAERDRRIQKGGYKVGANWYHSDTFSRSQQMGLVMMGAAIPTGLQWKTMGGGKVTMTQALAAQIFQAAAMSDIAVFAAADKAIANLAAGKLDSMAAIAWPANFEG